jgi:hypothetical protein
VPKLYIGTLSPLAPTASFSDIRSHRAKVSWIVICVQRYAISRIHPRESRNALAVPPMSNLSMQIWRISGKQLIVIFLSDASRKCNVINYRSYKSRRVTRSVLGGEKLAFANEFDCAYTLRKYIEKILGRKVPLSILTDSKSLFDIITKSSSTLEKLLMIDIAAARESYAKEELSDIGRIRGEHNPAETFTKDSPAAPKMLQTILTSGSLDHPIVQWIYR